MTPARPSRRAFLKACARLGAFAALGLLASRLVGGRTWGEICARRGLCRGCAVFAGCGLPQALSAKRRQGTGPA